MRGPASAFATLELEPGASRSAVEEAYRRLIKRYHPDRSGGDAQRAAEINRAYFELRRHWSPDAENAFAPPGPPRTHLAIVSGRRRRQANFLWPLLLGAGAAAAMAQGPTFWSQVPRRLADLTAPVLAPKGREGDVAGSVSFEEPLEEALIATSVDEALALAGTGGEEALIRRSRECHRDLRLRPSLKRLDQCAAFDNAVAAIEDRDPMHDRGLFNASSVTARQMTAASLLSNDYLSIERRLDRIRTRVEFRLAPRQPPLQVEVNAAEESANLAPLPGEDAPLPDDPGLDAPAPEPDRR